MSMVTSPSGNVLVPLILGALSVAAVQVATYVPESKPYLTEENLTAAAGFLAAVAIALVNAWTNGRLKSGVKSVQEKINKALPASTQIEVDGIAGPQTLEGTQKATGQ